HKCDHEEHRLKVCAPCGKKIVFGNRQRSEFSITENLAGLLKKHINDQFDASNSKFPISICSTCRKTIMEREKGNAKRPLPTMPNYEDMKMVGGRSDSNVTHTKGASFSGSFGTGMLLGSRSRWMLGGDPDPNSRSSCWAPLLLAMVELSGGAGTMAR
ncbi:hypothetical protein CBL_03853, partial [Carabus blaptoides fortunei]